MPGTITPPTMPWKTMDLTHKIERIQGSFKCEKPSSAEKNSLQLGEACRELESLFVYYLLKEMRATIPKSGFINGGKVEEIYTSMMDARLAEELSDKGGIGLSPILLEQLGGGPEHD